MIQTLIQNIHRCMGQNAFNNACKKLRNSTDKYLLKKSGKTINETEVIEYYLNVLQEGRILQIYLDTLLKRPQNTALWDEYS